MTRNPGLVAGLGLLLAAVSANAGTVIDRPIWREFPSAGEIGSFTPRRTEDTFEGAVTLDCAIIDRAGHLKCKVVEVKAFGDDPGEGYGDATVALIEQRACVDMVRTAGAAPGRTVRVHVMYKLSDS